jgi:hypothetical protein
MTRGSGRRRLPQLAYRAGALALAGALVAVAATSAASSRNNVQMFFLQGEQLVHVTRPGATPLDALHQLVSGLSRTEAKRGLRTYVPHGTHRRPTRAGHQEWHSRVPEVGASAAHRVTRRANGVAVAHCLSTNAGKPWPQRKARGDPARPPGCALDRRQPGDPGDRGLDRKALDANASWRLSGVRERSGAGGRRRFGSGFRGRYRSSAASPSTSSRTCRRIPLRMVVSVRPSPWPAGHMTSQRSACRSR